MKMRTVLVLLLLLLVIPADAQKRKGIRTKLNQEDIQRQERLERMRLATEKVMFIDSFVVNKNDFLRYYTPSPETGSIKRTREFFRFERHPNSYAHLNELGNRCYFSKHETDTTSNLYMSDFEEGQWSSPTPLLGINDKQQFKRVNYPFMMGDGITLYFAAVGGDGIGGYDIYTTAYDDEEDRFLQPTNIGMPFNSEANDYMYLIDEYDSLGWFVTDRRQPIDTVCVYVFIPSDVRQRYDAKKHTPEELARLSHINSIADTWTNKQRLQQALKRLRQHQTHKRQTAEDYTMEFVINDDVSYHRPSDFRYAANASRYQQLLALQEELRQVEKQLNKARNYFPMATKSERYQLSSEIRFNEQQLLQLNQKAHDLEKSIRNAEILFLTNNK